MKRVLRFLALSLATLGCGTSPCHRFGDDEVGELVAQLEGRCCDFHTEPTGARLDNSCRRHDRDTRGIRWGAGRHACAA